MAESKKKTLLPPDSIPAKMLADLTRNIKKLKFNKKFVLSNLPLLLFAWVGNKIYCAYRIYGFTAEMMSAVNNMFSKKFVKHKLSNVERMKVDEQKKAAQQGYDMDILPPDMKTYIKELETLLEDLEMKNERMFLVTFLVTNFSDNRKRLEAYNDRLNRIVLQANSKLIPLDYMQDLAFASMLPLCENRIEIERRLTTSSAAVFLPFSTKELFMGGDSVYYGLNPITW